MIKFNKWLFLIPLTIFISSITLADTFIVTNTNDDNNPGSLRDAITQANGSASSANPATINFNIPGSGPYTIQLQSQLPNIGSYITIEGNLDSNSQPEITIIAPNENTDVLTIQSAKYVTIKSLNISGGYYCIYINNGDFNTISGNAISNSIFGVEIYDGYSNTISDNTISNNYYGIAIDNGSSSNIASGNTISHNTYYGIYIGYIISSNTTSIGISNNPPYYDYHYHYQYYGYYAGYGSSFNTISGNTISHSGYYGIYVGHGGSSNSISGNTISNNVYNGVVVDRYAGNMISESNIFDNGASGITLQDDGNNNQQSPTVNSAIVCNTASDTASTLTITATAPNSPAGATFRLEFFINTANRNSSDITEGARYIYAVDTISAGSSVTRTFTVAAPLINPGEWVSATAINTDGAGGEVGDTSPFSSNTQILPISTLNTSSPTICLGGRSTLSVNITGGAQPYNVIWPDGSSSTNTSPIQRTVSPATTTTYSIDSITDNNGCSVALPSPNSATITVTPLSANASLVAFPTEICAGNTAALAVTITGGTPPYTVTWADLTTPQTGPSSLTRQVSPTSTTSYSISSIVDNNGCELVIIPQPVTIQVNQLPTAMLTTTPQEICLDNAVKLKLTLTGAAPFNIVWPDGITGSTNRSSAFKTFSPISTTIYTAAVTDANNCGTVFSNSATTQVNPLPQAFLFASPTNVCSKESSTSQLFALDNVPVKIKIIPNNEVVTLTVVPTGNAPFTLEWSDGFVQRTITGVTTRQVAPLVTTTYSLTIIDRNGCKFDLPQKIIVVVEGDRRVSGINGAIIDKYRVKLKAS